MTYPQYEEYIIEDEAKVAMVISGEKTLAEAGIIAELNKVCADRGCEVDWSFVKAFPKSFMLRIWKRQAKKSTTTKKSSVKSA